MAKSIATLRKDAKELGIAFTELRGLTTADEIQAVIDAHGKPTRTVKKKSTVAKKKVKKNSSRKSTTAPPTRKSSTAKRKTTTAKKKTTAKRGPSRRGQDEGGRNLLEDVDFTVTDGWNPREDSAPDRIVRALRKHKGNRSKAFDTLVGDLWDFVGKKNSKGEKRSKAEAEWQLRYRISRTAWDFAKRTGQHEPSTNRATYGEGGTGIGVSGGMPVAFRGDGWGKPVFGKKSRKKTTGTTKKTSTAKRKAASTKKRSTAKRGATKRKSTSRR